MGLLVGEGTFGTSGLGENEGQLDPCLTWPTGAHISGDLGGGLGTFCFFRP